MRVLHVLHHSVPYLSGYSVRSSYIVNLQRAAGLEPVVVTSGQHPNGDEPRESIQGIEYRRTPSPGSKLRFLKERAVMADLGRQVANAADELRPDVIHAHSPVLVGLPALRVARRLRIPFVYEVRDLWENASIDRGRFGAHSPSYQIARSLETYVLRRADAVITICQGLCDALTPRVRPGRQVHLVANGVDVDAFRPTTGDEELRKKWRLHGKQTVLYAGTFQPYEGLDVLIRSMRELLRLRPSAHLLIVGGSPGLVDGSSGLTREEQHLQSLVRELALERDVTFTGRIPHPTVRQMYALADVLVYPRHWTRTTALTTPLKPLEAMAMAKPVVASDVPAMRELVSHGTTGLLFEAGNHTDLAEKCAVLLNDSALRGRMGEAGREVVVRERNWPALVARYPLLYDELLRATTLTNPRVSYEVGTPCR